LILTKLYNRNISRKRTNWRTSWWL
jgi:hypothetical protein